MKKITSLILALSLIIPSFAYFSTQANNKAVSVRAYSFIVLYKHIVYQKHI